MRLILSRKGFDSSSGGCPSPIFPDGSLYSLPIPEEDSGIAYAELQHRQSNTAQLIADLSGNQKPTGHHAHLDPDLDESAYPRQPGWRPVFGQTGAAQGHLRNQNVQADDLFLFFGLFRRVELSDQHWRFVESQRPIHLLWGWMQIAEVVAIDDLAPNDLRWARHYHPHFRYPPNRNNSLYVAADPLSLPGHQSRNTPGAGVFRKFNHRLQLTDPTSRSVSQWRLPRDFYPEKGKPPLSYHSRIERWKRDETQCYLDSAARGQEFVLDLDYYPGVLDWIQALLTTQQQASIL